MMKSALVHLIILLSLTSAGWGEEGSPTPQPPSDGRYFVNLAEKVIPSVVNISTSFRVKNTPGSPSSPEELFRKFFERIPGAPNFPMPPGMGPQTPWRATALGSGFIIDSSGIIITNNHVVANADEIKIQFTEEVDEKPTDGKVIARDTELDIALIQVKTGRKLVPLIFGDSDALKVGEYVLAVGNPFGQGHSATHGIISAKGRVNPEFPLSSYLQTDAPINPGNSGGPLINAEGKVIGINNAIQAAAQGISFAIPINVVTKVLPQLKKNGKVQRGFLGILIEPLTPEIAKKIGVPPETQAPFITEVTPGRPGEKAGLQVYDVVLSVNDQKLEAPGQLINAVIAATPGETVKLKIIRDGKEKVINAKVGERPLPGEPIQPKAPPEPAAKIGMGLENLNNENRQLLGLDRSYKGVVISNVMPGGPADEAGLMPGDVIIEIDRKKVADIGAVQKQLKPGETHLIRVRRPVIGPDAHTVVILDLS